MLAGGFIKRLDRIGIITCDSDWPPVCFQEVLSTLVSRLDISSDFRGSATYCVQLLSVFIPSTSPHGGLPKIQLPTGFALSHDMIPLISPREPIKSLLVSAQFDHGVLCVSDIG
jgi:hypothetical protein